MMSLRTEEEYLAAVKYAELEFGPDHLQTGDALVALAEFYERCGLLEAANACDERIHEILEKYLSRE
jgi:hypothetical protein